MEIEIQKEIKEICAIRHWLSNDMLEAYIEYSAIYSRKYWLLLQSEYLKRMELEIAIL
jgi:hypothetical protein